MTGPRVLTGDRRAKALALYKSGYTIRQVAEEVGVSYGLLQRVVADAGLSRNRGHGGQGGGWTKGKPRGRVRVGGEPCVKGHPGDQTYDYHDSRGYTTQVCRTCRRDANERRRVRRLRASRAAATQPTSEGS